MRFDKLRYKRAIKTKEVNATNQFSNSLNDALLEKGVNAFWNSWRLNFDKKQVSWVVDGCSDDRSIADKFAITFSSVCVPNSPERHEEHCKIFNCRFSQYINSSWEHKLINVELVEKCTNQLKKVKR